MKQADMIVVDFFGQDVKVNTMPNRMISITEKLCRLVEGEVFSMLVHILKTICFISLFLFAYMVNAKQKISSLPNLIGESAYNSFIIRAPPKYFSKLKILNQSKC